MKVAIATTHRRVAGGAESYLRTLIPSLNEFGHDVLFCWESDAQASTERPIDEACGVPGHSLGSLEPLARIASFKPDVVYTHGLASPALEGQLAARFPTLLYAHNFFATCVSGTKRWKSHPGRPCTRLLSPRCLAAYLPRGCGGRNLLKAVFMYRQASRSNDNLDRFRRVLVASRYMEQEYARHTATPVHVLPYPLTIASPNGLSKAAPDAAVEVLFLSRLTPLKGGADLIRAVSLANARGSRPYRLHIAGGGPDASSLVELARALSVNAVHHGWVTAENRDRLLREAHVLAMPSLWPEPFGLSGLEAGAFGVPSVAYRFGGIPDWLESGKNGELADPATEGPAGLARALEKITASSEAYRAYSEGARAAAARFGLAGHSRALLRHFEEVL